MKSETRGTTRSSQLRRQSGATAPHRPRPRLPLRAAALLALALPARLPAADAPPAAPAAAYSNDFEKLADPNKVPGDFLVLSGNFTVGSDGKNHFLEAAGEPIEAIALLFGPKGASLTDVSARIACTSAGKTFPEFGIGTGAAGGYKIWVLAGQNALELRRGDEPRARVDYKGWKTGEWTSLRLRYAPAGAGRWKVEGKIWPAAEKEPEAWTISFEDDKAPATGQASIWANPYPGTPARFDDLRAGTGQ